MFARNLVMLGLLVASSVLSAPAASAQVPRPAEAQVSADPSVWVGGGLEQVVAAFGPPKTVYAVRGIEPWQDDVVFRYDDLDLYWFRDRVWQVRASTAYGLRVGDGREAATTLLGEPLHRLDDAYVYQLPGRAWPLRLRVGFDPEGRIKDLYVYRADF